MIVGRIHDRPTVPRVTNPERVTQFVHGDKQQIVAGFLGTVREGVDLVEVQVSRNAIAFREKGVRQFTR